ncbi:thiamine biosynthesis protein ThiJ [Longibacter salinarum]|uniref:Thiamine biosynthesis protein ThiJ n=1 Tax=Longibacter salinarum TaxID=1850348 RepID=A0A2A8D0B4_9BACT|nr:DJ-1/PfpI family protein [Longibacter salinarum]PEN14310.1 thiamine biosynthesis protein ThiJ [Longibacter salinarum]
MSDEAAIGILVFDDIEELDLAGPWEVFSAWGETGSGPPCVAIGASTDPVRCRFGLTVTPDVSIGETPPLQAVVVPGGDGSRQAAKNANLIEFVRDVSKDVRAVLSVCTGVRVLRAAGLLRGRTVTTHREAFGEVRAWPEADLDEDARYVQDGSIWTSAGVTAGIDLALAAVEAWSTREEADRVRAYLEYAGGRTE